MKRITTVALMLCLMLVTACRGDATLADGKTYECVGVKSQRKKDKNVIYEYSTRNIVVGVIFIETVVVPVVTVLEYLECPVGYVVPPT